MILSSAGDFDGGHDLLAQVFLAQGVADLLVDRLDRGRGGLDRGVDRRLMDVCGDRLDELVDLVLVELDGRLDRPRRPRRRLRSARAGWADRPPGSRRSRAWTLDATSARTASFWALRMYLVPSWMTVTSSSSGSTRASETACSASSSVIPPTSMPPMVIPSAISSERDASHAYAPTAPASSSTIPQYDCDVNLRPTRTPERLGMASLVASLPTTAQTSFQIPNSGIAGDVSDSQGVAVGLDACFAAWRGRAGRAGSSAGTPRPRARTCSRPRPRASPD